MESQSRTELRALVDEFGELAGQWRRQRASYVGQLQQTFACLGVGPPLEVAERYERARKQAWILLPPDARAGCATFREFVEGQTGEPLPGSLPDASEASADAILRYLCGAPTGQAPAGEKTEGGFWTVPDIASKFSLTDKQKDALQSRLKRWRKQNKGASTWREVRDGEAGRRDARFFYSLDAIWEMVEAIREPVDANPE